MNFVKEASREAEGATRRAFMAYRMPSHHANTLTEGSDTDVEFDAWETPNRISSSICDSGGPQQPDHQHERHSHHLSLVCKPSMSLNAPEDACPMPMLISIWSRDGPQEASGWSVSAEMFPSQKVDGALHSVSLTMGRSRRRGAAGASSDPSLPSSLPILNSRSDASSFLDFAALHASGPATSSVSHMHCTVTATWRHIATPRSRWQLISVAVVDHHSRAGTFCNGVPLVPHLPFELSAADALLPECFHVDVRLGKYFIARIGDPLWATRRRETVADAAVCTDIPADQPPSTRPKKQPRPKATQRQVAPPKKVVIIEGDIDDDVTFQDSGPHLQRGACYMTPALSCSAAGTPLTIITTGMRLSNVERERCESLRLVVNPPMMEFHTAKYLVVEPPLIRSVKLLTAIPFVEAFLHRSWLDAVMATGRLSVPAARHLYSETYTRRSVEGINNFRIETLMQRTTPHQRQQLMAGLRFFVHPEAQPQDEPHNDLKCVVLASGGSISRDFLDGNVDVVVLPCAPLPNGRLWEPMLMSSPLFTPTALSKQLESCIALTVDDLFRAVLQQSRPNISTITIEPHLPMCDPQPPPRKGRTKSTQPPSSVRPPAPAKRSSRPRAKQVR